MITSISAADYYDFFPSNDHAPGDIWSNLPTYGVLPIPLCSGLVVTPACDLANRKVETVTYVPIVPLKQYFGLRGNMTDVVRETEGQLQAAGLQVALRHGTNPTVTSADILAAQSLLSNTGLQPNRGKKELDAASRAEAGLSLLIHIAGTDRHPDPGVLYNKLVGSPEYSKQCRRLITNSYRLDVHFLPCDEQPDDWTAIPSHAVAMFRYPLTLPIDLIDLAATTADVDWQKAVAAFLAPYPCCTAISATRPLKALSVRPRFMADLLSRFISLYGRLGSPDFSPGMIDTYLSQIAGGKQ